MTLSDADDILNIINFYIANSTSYFSEIPLEKSIVSNMLNQKSRLPRYVALSGKELVGFGYAYDFSPKVLFRKL